jgi:hypothetical protein
MIIKADPSFGGGKLDVTGKSYLGADVMQKLVEYKLILNETDFDVSSAGNVSIRAGNSHEFNVN